MGVIRVATIVPGHRSSTAEGKFRCPHSPSSAPKNTGLHSPTRTQRRSALDRRTTTGSGEVGEGASGSLLAQRSRGDESNGLDSEGGQSLERIALLKLGEGSGRTISWERGRSISMERRRSRPQSPGFRWMKSGRKDSSVSPTYLSFLSFCREYIVAPTFASRLLGNC